MAKNRMTKFLAKELLYDYVSGSLEASKAKSLEEFIQTDDELKKELQSVSNSIQYASNLKRITLTQPYYQSLSDYVQKEGSVYYIKQGLKVGFKYSSVVAVVALLIVFFPTQKVLDYFSRDPNKVVLAQVETSDELSDIPVAMHGDLDEVEETSGDEVVALSPPVQTQNTGVGDLSNEEKENLEKELRKQEEDLQSAAEAEAKEPIEPVVAKEAAPEAKKPNLKGLLFRTFLKVQNKDVVATALLQKLKELEAVKAGSVNLGWKKPNGNSYFHFKISESNFEILKTYLSTIQKVEINSYPHPRVMEEGYMRMILEVEQL